MWHDIAPDAATAALAVIGALHVAWAFTPWPAPTYQALSKYVYGGPVCRLSRRASPSAPS